jgi:hypothetical protein
MTHPSPHLFRHRCHRLYISKPKAFCRFPYHYCRVPKTRGIHNQRLRKTKRYSQMRRAKIADETPPRLARRNVSTTFQLVRGTLNRTPRLHSDSYEASNNIFIIYLFGKIVMASNKYYYIYHEIYFHNILIWCQKTLIYI